MSNHCAICKYCRTSVSGPTKATSNFIRHLNRKHPAILGEFDDQSGQTSDPKKWEATEPREVKLTKNIVCFIANDLMPLSVIDSTAFIDILSTAEPCFTMPNRKLLSQKLLP